MSSRRLAYTFFNIFILILSSRSAFASETTPNGSPNTRFIRGISIDTGFGIVSSEGSDFHGGATMNVTMLARSTIFEFGGNAERGTALLSNHRAGLGGLAGLAIHDSLPFAFAILGEGGFHGYSNVVGAGADAHAVAVAHSGGLFFTWS